MLKAIQAYRAEQAVSLREAKAAIEQIRLAASSHDKMREIGIPASVLPLMDRGKTIAAMKAYRAEKRVSLREAKATVDLLMDLPRSRRT